MEKITKNERVTDDRRLGPGVLVGRDDDDSGVGHVRNSARWVTRRLDVPVTLNTSEK